MTRRALRWIGVGLAVSFAIPIGITAYHARQDEDAYREQLRLARAEGIPVTAAEYVALIPRVPDAQNAASLYRQLKTNLKGASQLSELTEMAAWHPTPEAIDAARAALAGHVRSLELAEEAARRPHCWFDRQWDGYATLFPELADMKRAAQLLGLRGSVATFEGKEDAALADTKRILVIAIHAGEEPHAIARLVRESIWIIALRHLASWAATHPNSKAYKVALSEAIAAFPEPDVRAEHLDEAYSILWLVDNAETKQGQEKLGLKPEDVPKGAEVIFPLLLSQSKSRIKIVKALRDCWAAYALPATSGAVSLEEARRHLAEAMLAFPTAAVMWERLGAGVDDGDRESNWQARRTMWVALSRALSGKEIARSISVEGLASPYDGTPLRYDYDGRRILIEVSGPTPIRLELPRPKR